MPTVFDAFFERLSARCSLPRLVVFVLGGTIALGCALHLYGNYQKIEADLRRTEDRRIKPFRDDQTVTETGRIFEMKREVRLREGRLFLIWWVKATDGRTWSCEYQGGFSQFRVGDAVRLIRQENADELSDYTAYLVGFSGGNLGTVTEVWALDNDELSAALSQGR